MRTSYSHSLFLSNNKYISILVDKADFTPKRNIIDAISKTGCQQYRTFSFHKVDNNVSVHSTKDSILELVMYWYLRMTTQLVTISFALLYGTEFALLLCYLTCVQFIQSRT